MADAVWLAAVSKGQLPSAESPETRRGALGPPQPAIDDLAAPDDGRLPSAHADRSGANGEPSRSAGVTPPAREAAAASVPVGAERGPAEARALTDRPIDSAGTVQGLTGSDAAEAAPGDASRLGRDIFGPAAVPPSLPNELAVVRALRPLKRKIPSRREEDRVLDEEGTAERAAEDGLWLPVTKPGERRWLDLTLVIDTGPAMALWRPVVGAFTSLVERLGIFRTIQICLLEVQHVDGEPAPVLRGGTPQAPPKSPAEVLDPSGRRLVLVLTDGVSSIWRNNTMQAVLATWGRLMPTAMVDLLPQRLWHRSGLELCRARLTTPVPLAPNSRWHVDWPDAWLDPILASTLPGRLVPVPVLELGSRWLGWWSRLIVGGLHRPSNAAVLLAGDGGAERTGLGSLDERDLATDDARGADPRPADRVMHFRGVAAPTAFRLATLLAAVPVNFAVAHLIQSEFVPESDHTHLAEVLTSGLLEPVDAVRDEQPTAAPDEAITFEFQDGVRAALLRGVRRSETAAVIRLVSSRMPGWPAAFGRFSEAIEAPDTTPDPEITAVTVPYAAIERVVLRALSGPYLSRAGRLEDSLERLVPNRATALLRSSEPTTTTSDRESNMNDTTSSISIPADRTATDEIPAEVTVDDRLISRPPETDMSGAPPRERSAVFGLAPPRERPGEDIPHIWGNVPPRNPNFTGRQEFLDQLHLRLAAGGTTAVLPAALHGMGGIGKTQIAVEYIYRHLRDYDLIWWIQAAQPAQIRASLTELAQRLHLPGSAEANTAVPVVQEALRVGRPYGRWLLVFDSAESPETVRQFFPTNGPGEILITSRNPDWVGIARPLELEVFQRSESKELLRRRGPEIDDQEADELGERLGDLPLAIEQAAAWRAMTGMPVREYLRLFDEKVAEILDTSAPSDYEVSVAAAWNVSFDELRKSNPAAHQLLQVCAFFSPEPIARSIFSGVRGISIAPDLDMALRDPMQLGRAIRDISRFGLAKIDHRHDTLQLHRLVQLVVSNRMTPQHRAEMRHGAHLLLANLDPNDPVPSTQWPRYQDILPHAYTSGVIECEDRWVAQLVLNLMTFLYHWGDHEEAARMAREAVDRWSASRGEDDPQTLRAAGKLGYYLWTLGRFSEAAEVNQYTLELQLQTSGENSEETLEAQSAVATDLRAKGEFPNARDLSEEMYQRAKGLFGDDDPTTLLTAHNLAVSLRLTGEYQRARLMDEDTYHRRTEVLGYDNVATISTLNGLIIDRRELGDYPWACVEQEKLVERARALFGEDRAATLRRMFHLAVARRKAGDHQGALELSAEVLHRFRLRYGLDDSYSMASALAQSIDLRHGGDLASARKIGEETFERYRKRLGEHHPHTLSAAVGLAVTLRHLGDVPDARQLDERSLEQFRLILGPDHPYAIVAMINLGSDLAALGESEAAVALDTEALDRAQEVLGADHPTTLATSANLALDLRTLGRTQDAETRFAEVVSRYRAALGETHPATIAVAGGARSDCDIDPLPL